MSIQVFISYSRSNFAHARLLHDLLQARLNCDIFMDLTSIEPGAYFPRTIEEVESSCTVVIALIGKTWLSVDPSNGRRPVDDPDNWARREIAAALRQNIRIVPVLLENVSMPAALDLPADISTLAHYQAIAVRDSEFDRDVERLVMILEREIVQDLVGTAGTLTPKHILVDLIYYFPRFLKLIVMPKRVVRAYAANPDEEIVRATVFLAISLVLFSVFCAPLYIDEKRMMVLLAIQFFMLTVLMFASTAILQLSWYCVGGRAPFGRYLSLNSYYHGVVLVLGIFLVLAALGVLRIFDPQLIELITMAVKGDIRPLIASNPAQSTPLRIAAWIMVIGNLLLLIWSYGFWGAYREINQVTRFKSAAALLIANMIFIPVGVMYVLVQEGLMNVVRGK